MAAGQATRFGRLKQYEVLAGRRVLDWSVAAARSTSEKIVLVVPPERGDDVEPGVDAVVAGGATRSASVRAGLAAVAQTAEVIVVHDAARPLASASLFAAAVAGVRNGYDAAIPGLEVVDTVKRVDDDGEVVETLDRAGLVTVQTPQAFRATALRLAHEDGAAEATDDAALVERSGGTVLVVAGEAANVKITGPDDLATAEMYLR